MSDFALRNTTPSQMGHFTKLGVTFIETTLLYRNLPSLVGMHMCTRACCTDLDMHRHTRCHAHKWAVNVSFAISP